MAPLQAIENTDAAHRTKRSDDEQVVRRLVCRIKELETKLYGSEFQGDGPGNRAGFSACRTLQGRCNIAIFT